MTTLTPTEFTEYTEQVLKMGATKYGADSWKFGRHFTEEGNTHSVLRHVLRDYGLTLADTRHVIDSVIKPMRDSNVELGRTESQFDDESELLHLKHAATRILMAIYLRENGIVKDQRS